MGEAKRRGAYEERVAEAVSKRWHEDCAMNAAQHEMWRLAREMREAESDQTPAWADGAETPTAS